MKKRRRVGKDRAPLATTTARDISQAPEMRELKAVFRRMDEAEQARTIHYLKDKEEHHEEGPGR